MYEKVGCTSTRLKQMENLSAILMCGFDCIIPHTVLAESESVRVTEAFTFTCSEDTYTELSHDYMPLKRYCSFCLVGKHLSRDVTLTADKDSDLCIILSVNTSHTALLYNGTVLKTNTPPKAANLRVQHYKV